MGKKESEQLFQSDLYSLQKIRLIIFSLFGTLILSAILSACANKGIITGGEKDTIPPVLVSTIPINQSLDYKGTEIVLTFDERVQATQLQRKLLITPFSDTQYKVKVNKNIVQLTFEESFADSTTFTLNFSDAVTDVTENNPGQNVVVAFSTWHIIDSLTIFGKIVDLMTNEPVESAAVSVYEADDTLDIFSGKPYYYARTDEFGRFSIQNMRGGRYRLFAFLDENSNYLNEPTAEAHGFIRDTLIIENQEDSIIVPLILQDVQELKLVNTRANGNHFDIRYNKYIQSYEYVTLDSQSIVFPSTLTAENAAIRFYEIDNGPDSTGYILTANDSVGNSKIDTIYVKFTDRELSLSGMETRLTPINNSDIDEELELQLRFNKPIASFTYDSLLIKYDTLKTVGLDSTAQFEWNWNKTQLSIRTKVEKGYLKNRLAELQIIQDSLTSLDSIRGVLTDTTIRESEPRKIDPNKIQFYAAQGSFISVENDSSELMRPRYEFKQPEEFGKISGSISIDSTYFVVQLINDKYQIIDEQINARQYQFEYVPPGSYNIRVLADTNGDGQWSFGNIANQIAPEAVYFHPTFVELRANWEINNIDLTVEK